MFDTRNVYDQILLAARKAETEAENFNKEEATYNAADLTNSMSWLLLEQK